MRLAGFFVYPAFLAIAGCATPPPIPEGTGAKPFVIEQALQGDTVARGEFRSITGVQRGFNAQLHGKWDGRYFTLVEDFVYDDGEKDRKTWRLERVAPGKYIGHREDVVGKAIGTQDGNVFRLEYDVVLPAKKGKGTQVHFRDVMALNPEGAVVNNAVVSFWGFRVGHVHLVIQRTGPSKD